VTSQSRPSSGLRIELANLFLTFASTGEIIVTARNLFFAQFFYRVNSNKSVESICGDCFLASPASEETAKLQAWEHAHRCSTRIA
jgi:hypothetical protein